MAGYIKIIFVFIFIIYLFYSCTTENKENITGGSTYEELNIPSNLIIVDSLILSNNYKAYWFCIDFGIRGYSTGRIGVAKNKIGLVKEESILVISDGITDISIDNDTLYIECIEGYELDEVEVYPPMIQFFKVGYSGQADKMIVNRIEKDMGYPLIDMPSVE